MTEHRYTAIIIGGGLAGTSVALALTTAGHSVALIDTHPVYPDEFRAEKLGRPQMDQFDRLGLAEQARRATTPVDEIWVSRYQRLLSRHSVEEYGLRYAALVNELRAALQPAVTLTIGRVAEIETGPEEQNVVLSDGRRLRGRLIVLATGLGDVLRRKVGVGKTVLSAKHSISFGFDLAAPVSTFPFRSLTLYGDTFGSRIAYATLFPIGETMRANLFTYHDPAEAWVKAFRADPEATLRDALPGLTRHCSDLAVAGPVEMRPVDLVRAEDYLRDGIVLLGDAFLSPCPIPGTGIGKVLTDVERLCSVHLPRWLESPGMGAGKIASFYDDPVKTASDRHCIEAGLYSRSLATDPAMRWTVRRWRNFAGRHVLHGIGALHGIGHFRRLGSGPSVRRSSTTNG